MKLNEHTAIVTPRLLLVPYEARHVARYHEWMQDPAIQQATASEPLSLAEEYENQLSWRTSADKLTFILCRRSKDPASAAGAVSPAAAAEVTAGVDDTDDAMVGDINLFLTPCTDDDDCEGAEKVHESSTAGCDHSVVGEIDVMIATISDRGKGLGRAAVTALLLYLARNLDAILACYVSGLADGRPARLQRLVAKIHASNTASRALFASLGFEKKGEPNYFGEVEMVLTGFPAAVTRAAWYKEAEEGYSEVRYFRPDLDPVKDDKSSIL